MTKAKFRISAKEIALLGVCSAVVCVATMYLRIAAISVNGYITFGDTFIFLFGALFGPVCGTVAGALGSAIADLIGYPIYAPFTFVIKGLEGFLAGFLSQLFFRRFRSRGARLGFTVLSFTAAAAEMIVLYFFAASILAKTWTAGVAEILANLIQGGVSVALATTIFFFTDLAGRTSSFHFFTAPVTKEEPDPDKPTDRADEAEKDSADEKDKDEK